MRSLLRSIPGSVYIVMMGAAFGLISNLVRPDGLPMIRKPLRETRGIATKEQLGIARIDRAGAPRAQVSASTAGASAPNVVVIAKQPATSVPAKQEMPAPVVAPVDVAPTLTGSTESATPESGPAETSSSEPQQVPGRKVKVEALFTTLADAKVLFDNRSALFLDGRPIEDYEAQHIVGALDLYYEQIDKLYEQVLGSVPMDRLIVTYCSDPECDEAIALADALVARGHTKVVILMEGLPGWNDAGYPTTTGKEPG